jgi:glycosyltransferase involved in cell wall biosynthesis
MPHTTPEHFVTSEQLASADAQAGVRAGVVSHAMHSTQPSGKPLFTIAIPTFNRAQWLRRCVASALSQTFSSYEVVVSDNASEDETADVLDQLSDPRLRVLRQESNIGPIRNWNACLASAHGSYVVMLSDDDIVTEYFLERCSSLITDDVDLPVVVAQGDVLFTMGVSVRLPAVLSQSLQSGVCDGTEILLEFLRGKISPQMCTVAIGTEILRANGGFPDGWQHTGDLVSWVPLLLQGRAGFVNESCGTRTSHPETQTAHLSRRTRFSEIDRLSSVIVEEAEHRVRNPVVLSEIKTLARRYVARNFLGYLAAERRAGDDRVDIASAAWEWRRQLLGTGVTGFGMWARPLALFVLPLIVTDALTAARRSLRKRTRTSSQVISS